MRWLLLISAYAFANIVGCPATAPKPPAYYRLVAYPALGATHCKALAMNDRGVVAGRNESKVLLGSPLQRACLLEPGKQLPLPMAPARGRNLTRRYDVFSYASDLNSTEVTVGWIRTNSLKSGRRAMAVVWDKRSFQPIPIPDAVQSFAYGINDEREIVGSYENKDGFLRAFGNGGRFEGTRDLGTLGGKSARAYDLNDHGVVVGVSTLTNGQRRAFSYRDGKLLDLGTLGGKTSQANAVNSHGHVVGVSQTRYGVFHAFLYREDKMFDLGTLGGSFSYPYAIYSDLVVGVSEDRNRLRRGFISNSRHMWDLNFLVKEPKNWFVTEAVDINRQSEILAMARNPQGVLQPVKLVPIRR